MASMLVHLLVTAAVMFQIAAQETQGFPRSSLRGSRAEDTPARSLGVNDTRGKHQGQNGTGTSCGNPARFFECVDQQEASPFPNPCPNATAFAWCDQSRSVDERVDLLVKEMNFTELLGQVSNDIFGGVSAIPRLGVNQYNFIREDNHGLLLNNVCRIPTVFPQVIVMAGAFDQDLWQRIGEASAIEARYNFNLGKQNSLFLQTNFNILIDPRWGRAQEVPGEDPYLSSQYAKAWIEGVQTKTAENVSIAGLSCKHYTAYSLEGGGGYYPTKKYKEQGSTIPHSNRHHFNAIVPVQDLWDTHLPVYKTCAAAGAKGVMTAYNAINGTPSAADGYLTNTVLRDTFGFKGTVVTDCGAVEDIWLRQNYASNASEAARLALEGGTDIECGNVIKASAKEKEIPLLRAAVSRSFRVRFELGEFDAPVEKPIVDYDQAAHAKLAFDVTVQGSTLLKNTGATLPLKTGTRIALLGPMRDVNWPLMGNYAAHYDSFDWEKAPYVTTLQEGLAQCGLVGSLTLPNLGGGPFVCSATEELVAGHNSVQSKPENVDAVVLTVGLFPEDDLVGDVDMRHSHSYLCQAGCLESEGCDRPNLKLPPGQAQLIERAASWGLPLVLVVVSGGPLDLAKYSLDPRIGAILYMGYPGQQAGVALAHMLFGVESPTGRLTHTFYNSNYTDRVAMTTMNLRPDPASAYPGRTYRFVDESWSVYKFGHGLSYFSWNYSWSAVPERSTALKPGGFKTCTIGVTLKLMNSAAAPSANASTSVLLFLSPPTEGMDGAPKKQLASFKRAHTHSVGAWDSIVFELATKDFHLADPLGDFHLVTGRWRAQVGEPLEISRDIVVENTGCTAL